MFNKYLRSYPVFMQFLLFGLMIFILFSSMLALSMALVPKLTGVSFTDISKINEHSSREIINAAVLFQFISSLSIFALPALLFAYLAHPRPASYLGMRRPGKPIHWILTILIMIGAMPVFLAIEGLLSQFNLGATAHSLQQQSDTVMKGMLNMHSPIDFIKVLTVLAIAPAFGEELFFRGIFMRFLKKVFRGMTIPILLTSFAFAFMHTTVYGFLSIFLAGVLLAVIYYLTGSIFCSMLAHFLNNGLQIILVYLSNDNATLKAAMDSNSIPAYLPITGGIIFIIAFYLLLKNKTPLPPDWASDYTKEELSEKAL